MTGVTPIQRFLGLPEGADSPFDLLGIAPEACDGPAILAALERRLERVARHPEARGHEAEEVRLALHTAAAQLADPAVRAALAAQSATPRGVALAPGGAEGDPAVAAFREAALPLFIARGGLNARARRRLIALAHAHGLDLAAVRRALRPTPPPTAQVLFPPPQRVPSKTIYEDLREVSEMEGRRVARRMRSALAMLAIFIVAIIVAVALATLLPGLEPGLSPAPTEPSGGSGARPAPDSVTAPEAPLRTDRRPSLNDLSRPDPIDSVARLRAAAALLDTDPGDAAWRFDETARRLARWWTTFDAASVAACVEAAAGFIHKAPPGAESSRRALAAVGAGADALADRAAPLTGERVTEAVWSVGVLTRLMRDGEVRAEAASEVASRLGAALPSGAPPGDATFRTGAEAAMRALIDRLPVSDPSDRPLDAWRAWRDAAVALAGPADRAQLTALALDAAERILKRGPPPSTDPTSRDVLYFLLASVDWRSADGANAGTDAQSRALAWFDDPAVPSDDLGVVTEWIFSSSKAPGIDSAMILPRSADAAARTALRDRYISAWRPGSPAATAGRRAELAAAWDAAAAHNATRTNDPPLLVASLARTAALARVNEAAAMRWRGDLDGAADVLSALTKPIDDALRTASQSSHDADAAQLISGLPPPGDGAWAVEYLSAAQNQAARIKAVTSLEARDGPLGPVDADVLAEAALLDPASEARDRASHIVRTRAAEALVVNGLLEALPGAPRRPATSTLISDVTNASLPNPSSAAWPAAARRALVGKLIAQLTSKGGGEALDLLAGVVADAYAAQSSRGAPAQSSSAAGQVDPAEAAESLWRLRRAEAERSTLAGAPDALAELDRRLAGRLGLASGPVQRFAALQTTLSELLARVIAAERPATAGAVEQIMTEAGERRRGSSNIGAQLEATERAITLLWALRFGEPLTAHPEGSQ